MSAIANRHKIGRIRNYDSDDITTGVPAGTHAVAWNSDLDLLSVTYTDGTNSYVQDVKSGNRLLLSSDTTPYGLAYNPVRKRLEVIDLQNDAIRGITQSAVDGSFSDTGSAPAIAGGTSWQGLAIDSDGTTATYYALENGLDSVYVYDPTSAGGYSLRSTHALSHADGTSVLWGIAIYKDFILILDQGHGKIYCYRKKDLTRYPYFDFSLINTATVGSYRGLTVRNDTIYAVHDSNVIVAYRLEPPHLSARYGLRNQILDHFRYDPKDPNNLRQLTETSTDVRGITTHTLRDGREVFYVCDDNLLRVRCYARDDFTPVPEKHFGLNNVRYDGVTNPNTNRPREVTNDQPGGIASYMGNLYIIDLKSRYAICYDEDGSHIKSKDIALEAWFDYIKGIVVLDEHLWIGHVDQVRAFDRNGQEVVSRRRYLDGRILSLIAADGLLYTAYRTVGASNLYVPHDVAEKVATPTTPLTPIWPKAFGFPPKILPHPHGTTITKDGVIFALDRHTYTLFAFTRTHPTFGIRYDNRGAVTDARGSFRYSVHNDIPRISKSIRYGLRQLVSRRLYSRYAVIGGDRVRSRLRIRYDTRSRIRSRLYSRYATISAFLRRRLYVRYKIGVEYTRFHPLRARYAVSERSRTRLFIRYNIGVLRKLRATLHIRYDSRAKVRGDVRLSLRYPISDIMQRARGYFRYSIARGAARRLYMRYDVTAGFRHRVFRARYSTRVRVESFVREPEYDIISNTNYSPDGLASDGTNILYLVDRWKGWNVHDGQTGAFVRSVRLKDIDDEYSAVSGIAATSSTVYVLGMDKSGIFTSPTVITPVIYGRAYPASNIKLNGIIYHGFATDQRHHYVIENTTLFNALATVRRVERLTGGEITLFSLDPANADAQGLAYDGTHFCVIDPLSRKVFVYSKDGARQPHLDIALPVATRALNGITFHRGLLYVSTYTPVSDGNRPRLWAYRLQRPEKRSAYDSRERRRWHAGYRYSIASAAVRAYHNMRYPISSALPRQYKRLRYGIRGRVTGYLRARYAVASARIRQTLNARYDVRMKSEARRKFRYAIRRKVRHADWVRTPQFDILNIPDRGGGLAFGPGAVYVADRISNKVLRYDIATGADGRPAIVTSSVKSADLALPTAIAYYRGYVYVFSWNNIMRVYHPDTLARVPSLEFNTSSVTSSPAGAAVYQDHLYVVDASSDKVFAFDGKANVPSRGFSLDSGNHSPASIAVFEGVFYVIQNDIASIPVAPFFKYVHKMFSYNPDGTASTKTVPSFAGDALKIDPSGSLRLDLIGFSAYEGRLYFIMSNKGAFSYSHLPPAYGFRYSVSEKIANLKGLYSRFSIRERVMSWIERDLDIDYRTLHASNTYPVGIAAGGYFSHIIDGVSNSLVQYYTGGNHRLVYSQTWPLHPDNVQPQGAAEYPDPRHFTPAIVYTVDSSARKIFGYRIQDPTVRRYVYDLDPQNTQPTGIAILDRNDGLPTAYVPDGPDRKIYAYALNGTRKPELDIDGSGIFEFPAGIAAVRGMLYLIQGSGTRGIVIIDPDTKRRVTSPDVPYMPADIANDLSYFFGDFLFMTTQLGRKILLYHLQKPYRFYRYAILAEASRRTHQFIRYGTRGRVSAKTSLRYSVSGIMTRALHRWRYATSRRISPGKRLYLRYGIASAFIRAVKYVRYSVSESLPEYSRLSARYAVRNSIRTFVHEPARDFKTTPANGQLQGIARWRDMIYVLDYTDAMAYAYAADTGTYTPSRNISMGFTTPAGMTVYQDHLYVAFRSGDVRAYDLQTRNIAPSRNFALAAANGLANAMALHEGRFYVPDYTDRKVYCYETDGTPVPSSDFGLTSGNTTPTGAVSINGVLYVDDFRDKRMYAYRDGTYSPSEDILTPGKNAIGGTYYSDGYLYAADNSQDRICYYREKTVTHNARYGILQRVRSKLYSRYDIRGLTRVRTHLYIRYAIAGLARVRGSLSMRYAIRERIDPTIGRPDLSVTKLPQKSNRVTSRYVHPGIWEIDVSVLNAPLVLMTLPRFRRAVRDAGSQSFFVDWEMSFSLKSPATFTMHVGDPENPNRRVFAASQSHGDFKRYRMSFSSIRGTGTKTEFVFRAEVNPAIAVRDSVNIRIRNIAMYVNDYPTGLRARYPIRNMIGSRLHIRYDIIGLMRKLLYVRYDIRQPVSNKKYLRYSVVGRVRSILKIRYAIGDLPPVKGLCIGAARTVARCIGNVATPRGRIGTQDVAKRRIRNHDDPGDSG